MVTSGIGVIGLGVMGSAISHNLLAAGFRVVGFDVDPLRVGAFVEEGGNAAASPLLVAESVDVMILSLPHVVALSAVIDGEGGLAMSPPRGDLVVLETSTLPLGAKLYARDTLAQSGIRVLDSPLSGTGTQTRAKDVIAYVSGDESAAVQALPALHGFTRRHFYAGEFGNGSKLKYVANLLVTIHNLSTAEAILLARRAGLDERLMLEAIGDGAGASRMLQVRGPLMASGTYDEPSMRVDVFQKDLEIIRGFAHEVHSPTPLFHLSSQYYEAAMAQGRAAQDTACLLAVLEQLTMDHQGFSRPDDGAGLQG